MQTEFFPFCLCEGSTLIQAGVMQQGESIAHGQQIRLSGKVRQISYPNDRCKDKARKQSGETTFRPVPF
ncbi:MAG: hypothetical protein ACO1PZ_09960 [Gammaproteobacteria bacterium]